ncbi:DNA polymerase IV [compost metagenome]
MLAGEADGATRFRLIGIGADSLADAAEADLPNLFAQDSRPGRIERTIDDVRRRHGDAALRLGRGLPDFS